MTTRCVVLIWTLLAGMQAQGQVVTLGVRHMPTPVVIDGSPVLYYELWLTPTALSPLALEALTVVNAADSSVIATFAASELKRRYSTLAGPAKELVLAPGTPGLLYLEVTLPVAGNYPRLAHKLEVTDARTNKTLTIRGGTITLPTQPSLVLGAPLRGGPWAGVYEPGWERGHRRVLYTVNDTVRVPGRFAIDFILLNPQARMTHHNPDSIVNWYGYAAAVLAVADGVVVATRNDFPESPTLSGHHHNPPEKSAGNYIALDIGHGRYVFYEHLKPGSVVAKTGQRVKKGERIAALGFTGQSTGPHLHLHVADRNSTLGAEGLPFALEKFTLYGSYPNAEGLGDKPWIPASNAPASISNQRPVPNAVITFP